jgi:hypothetical protein
MHHHHYNKELDGKTKQNLAAADFNESTRKREKQEGFF